MEPKIIEKYPLLVNYDLTLEELVKLGNYAYGRHQISSDRQVSKCGTGKKRVTIELINFNKSMYGDEAIKKIESLGYRPANIHELLTLGIKLKQFKYCIAELGTLWIQHGNKYVLGLMPFRGEKELIALPPRTSNYASGCNSCWPDNWYFAIVKKFN